MAAVTSTTKPLSTMFRDEYVAAMPTVAPAEASRAIDPIFGAIDAFRRADASCVAVDGDIPDELGDQCDEAYSVVLRTRPTTPAGLAALTTWAREQADWLCANASVLPGEDLCALTAAIDDATRGMSGLKPWSTPLLTESAGPETQPDPIFGMIEAHRKAHIAHMVSLGLQARFERRYGIDKGGWVSTKPCHDEDDAFMAFVAEPATTVRGLFAKLAYFDELTGEFETEWMVRERAEAVVLIQSFAASLKNIGVQS